MEIDTSVCITGGSKVCRRLIQRSYSPHELTELDIKNIVIIRGKDDWKQIVLQKLPIWKTELLRDCGHNVFSVRAFLDEKGNLCIREMDDKEEFLRNLHHEIGQAKYRMLSDVRKKYFCEEIAVRFEFDYVFDPIGEYPGDNDRYALLYESFKTMGRETFKKESGLTDAEIENMGFE